MTGALPADIENALTVDNVSVLRVLHRGQLVHEHGPQDVPVPVHSVRKSVINALIGTLIDAGALQLDTTLADLGIDDQTPLTATESAATVEDLLTSSSGIYLPIDGPGFDPFTGNPAPWPPPASAVPGTRFHYNNWDFNALGEIYQRVSGRSLLVAFDHVIARPLRFLDWDVFAHSRLRDGHDPLGASPRYPNYSLRLSPRDLATFGQLYLDGGELHGARVISADWIRRSTHTARHTGLPEPFARYGYLWWVGSGAPGTLPAGSFAAVGLGGPVLCVIPSHDIVIVTVDGGIGSQCGRMWLPLNVITTAGQSIGDRS